MRGKLPTPWLGFLRDVDRALNGPVEVHCLGGFVLAVLWELPRPTGDVDFVEIEPSDSGQEIHDLVLAKLGRNSARDRADVDFLVQRGIVDQDVLRKRYEAELRPHVLNEDRHTTTLRLWLDEFFGEKGGATN